MGATCRLPRCCPSPTSTVVGGPRGICPPSSGNAGAVQHVADHCQEDRDHEEEKSSPGWRLAGVAWPAGLHHVASAEQLEDLGHVANASQMVDVDNVAKAPWLVGVSNVAYMWLVDSRRVFDGPE